MSSDIELPQEDSEDEFDWEEVEVPAHHLEITLNAKPKTDDANKKKAISYAERLIRIDCHKIHTVSLIANARVRNKWINDPLLHARLLSLTPLHLQTAFGAIHKSRVPDQNQRGRMFERAVEALALWWSGTYFDVIPAGHIRNHTFDDIQQRLEIRGLHIPHASNPDAAPDVDTLQDIIGEDVETIRSEKSLMKHALMASGSRDTSAQLFTALCRALGIPARLVASIQSVPWQAGVGKPKPKYDRKGKGKGKEFEKEKEKEEIAPIAGPSHWEAKGDGKRLDGAAPKTGVGKGKQKAQPVVKLRKQKPKGNILGAPPRLASPDPLTTPPVYWTEVFSRPDSRWMPVDPIRGIVNKRKVFDPTPLATSANANSAPPSRFPPGPSVVNRRVAGTKVENRMVYVLAFEEDGYARDVTPRYARDYAAKVVKVQGGSSAANMGGGGKGRQAWWASVLKCIERPYALHRDDLEDQELEILQLKEGMPTTVGGFKDHPLYALERHLKQTETIHPPPPATPELGKFRGEPVYPRSAVVPLKTSENWMRNMGRVIRGGEQPMKMVKMRAGTVNRMRELEAMKDDLRVAGEEDAAAGAGAQGDGPEIMQGLYAYSQTEPYIPEPVVDGRVPKNRFGNIDLYVPAMLPKGAAHIPYKGVAKIARKLGLDYAEAVTGFEFKKRRALPVMEGIVVAVEHEPALLEAYWEAERAAEEKARTKREERALKQWTRLIYGLRIRQRLQAQYAAAPSQYVAPTPSASASTPAQSDAAAAPETQTAEPAGGFLAGADRVVRPFHLPRNTHPVLPSPRPGGISSAPDPPEDASESEDEPPRAPLELHTYDLDVDMEAPPGTGAHSAGHAHEYVPKTMQEMAEEVAARAVSVGDGVEEIDIPRTSLPTPASVAPAPDAAPENGRTLRARGKPQAPTLPPMTTPKGGKKTKGKGKGKGKRARPRDSDSDEEDDGEGTPGTTASPGVGASATKRARTRSKPAVDLPTPTRTLRPRAARAQAVVALSRGVDEEEEGDEEE